MGKILMNAVFLVVGLLLSGCYGSDNSDFLFVDNAELVSVAVRVNDKAIPDAEPFPVERMFDNTKKSITVETGDKLDVVLNLELDPGFSPIYRWEMFENSTSRDIVTGEFPPVIQVGDAKDLSMTVTGAPVEHILRCIVTNEHNNTEKAFYFSIRIAKPSGYAVLYETPQGGDFDFFKTPANTLGLTESVFYPNVFSSANGSYIPNPKTLAQYSSNFMTLNNGSMMSLNTNTYKITSSETSKFFLLFAPPFSRLSYHGSNQYSYVILDNEIYFSGTGFNFKASLTPGGNYHDEIIVNAGMAQSNSLWVFFNKNTRGFEYGNFNGGVYQFVTDPTSLFDISNTQMDLIYAESGFERYVNAIMKDDQGRVYFCELDLRYQGTGANQQRTVRAVRKTEITNLTGFSESSKWAMHTRAPFVFYGAGNSIRKFDQLTGQSSVVTNVEGEITLMKVYRHADESLNGRTLYVATYDGTEGRLYEIQYDVLTGNVIGTPNVYPFGGRIVELKYF